jgi:hypothetical protein
MDSHMHIKSLHLESGGGDLSFKTNNHMHLQHIVKARSIQVLLGKIKQ